MKQQIVKVSNIRFKDFNGVNRLNDVTETFAYEFMHKRNPNASDIDVAAAYVKSKMMFEHDVLFDYEYIDIDSDEYVKAQRLIASYEDFDCFADDAGNQYEQHPYKKYVVTWPSVMYMYCDEWFIHGYSMFIQGKDLDAAFNHVIYDYLLTFLPVYVS